MSTAVPALPLEPSAETDGTFARRRPGSRVKLATDRRRHKRVEVLLLGRFMRANRQEFPCRIHDISVGGLALQSPVDVEIGERIVALFEPLGALEGHVVRHFNGGFALRLAITAHKREKLAASLTFLVNRPHLGALAERRHERARPTNSTQTLTLVEGLTVTCEVLDVSLSGASIATPARPQIGMEIKLGSVRCRA
jgi:hypothetical protein